MKKREVNRESRMYEAESKLASIFAITHPQFALEMRVFVSDPIDLRLSIAAPLLNIQTQLDHHVKTPLWEPKPDDR